MSIPWKLTQETTDKAAGRHGLSVDVGLEMCRDHCSGLLHWNRTGRFYAAMAAGGSYATKNIGASRASEMGSNQI
jgi:hypothetical protein